MAFSKKSLQFIIAALVACLPLFGFANAEQDSLKVHTETIAVTQANAETSHDEVEVDPNSMEGRKAKINAFKMHHVLDSHEFSLFENDGQHFGFPLPIILWDNGVHIFSSSKFEHGHAVAESDGNYYRLGHDEKIYKVESATAELSGDEHHPTNAKVLDFSITKSVFTLMIVALLMFWLFSSLAK